MFYDGTKLLSLKDLDGNTPEIYISTSNRSAGKTTYFNRLEVNRFIKAGKKFCLVYRYAYELDDCADKFFKEIGSLFFPSYTLESKRRSQGSYHELYLNNISCGYAVALNKADEIKKQSHFFSDVDSMLFDEFQSETNHYCNNEVQKLLSVHTSIARGGGKQVRYVPIYMLSNPVSIINPYYTALGITSRLRSDTKFLKGIGWVLEQGFNETASNAQKDSAFNRAFSNEKYYNYNTQAVYLNDNTSFIEKPTGKSKYICTLRYDNKDFAVREYPEQGLLYCDDRVDISFPLRIAVTTDDHNINFVMLKNNSNFLNILKYFFNKGCFRFKDLKAKECILTALSY